MTEDIFADRVAKVRERFVSTLAAKIDETCAAVPKLGEVAPPNVAVPAVADAYLRIHGIAGIGRTVGFPETGRAALAVEDVLRPPYRAARGLTSDEISLLKNSLQALRAVALRELQTLHSLPQ
jgi:Hpt domain